MNMSKSAKDALFGPYTKSPMKGLRSLVGSLHGSNHHIQLDSDSDDDSGSSSSDDSDSDSDSDSSTCEFGEEEEEEACQLNRMFNMKVPQDRIDSPTSVVSSVDVGSASSTVVGQPPALSSNKSFTSETMTLESAVRHSNRVRGPNKAAPLLKAHSFGTLLVEDEPPPSVQENQLLSVTSLSSSPGQKRSQGMRKSKSLRGLAVSMGDTIASALATPVRKKKGSCLKKDFTLFREQDDKAALLEGTPTPKKRNADLKSNHRNSRAFSGLEDQPGNQLQKSPDQQGRKTTAKMQKEKEVKTRSCTGLDVTEAQQAASPRTAARRKKRIDLLSSRSKAVPHKCLRKSNSFAGLVITNLDDLSADLSTTTRGKQISTDGAASSKKDPRKSFRKSNSFAGLDATEDDDANPFVAGDGLKQHQHPSDLSIESRKSSIHKSRSFTALEVNDEEGATKGSSSSGRDKEKDIRKAKSARNLKDICNIEGETISSAKSENEPTKKLSKVGRKIRKSSSMRSLNLHDEETATSPKGSKVGSLSSTNHTNASQKVRRRHSLIGSTGELAAENIANNEGKRPEVAVSRVSRRSSSKPRLNHAPDRKNSTSSVTNKASKDSSSSSSREATSKNARRSSRSRSMTNLPADDGRKPRRRSKTRLGNDDSDSDGQTRTVEDQTKPADERKQRRRRSKTRLGSDDSDSDGQTKASAARRRSKSRGRSITSLGPSSQDEAPGGGTSTETKPGSRAEERRRRRSRSGTRILHQDSDDNGNTTPPKVAANPKTEKGDDAGGAQRRSRDRRRNKEGLEPPRRRRSRSLRGLKDLRTKLGHSSKGLGHTIKGPFLKDQSLTDGSISSLTMSSRLYSLDDMSLGASERSRFQRRYSTPRLFMAGSSGYSEGQGTPGKLSRWESRPHPSTNNSTDVMPAVPDHDLSSVGPTSTSNGGRWCAIRRSKSMEADSTPILPRHETSSHCRLIYDAASHSAHSHSFSGLVSELTPLSFDSFATGESSRQTPLEDQLKRNQEKVNNEFNSWMTSLSTLLLLPQEDQKASEPVDPPKKRDSIPRKVRRHSLDSASHASFSGRGRDDDSKPGCSLVLSLLEEEHDNAPRKPARTTSFGSSVQHMPCSSVRKTKSSTVIPEE